MPPTVEFLITGEICIRCGVFETMMSAIFPNLHLFQDKKDNIIFTITISKSILSVQSDHIYHALRLAERGVNTYEVNRLMLSCIDYKTPEAVFIDEMNKLLFEYKEINLKRNQMN